MSVFEFAAGGVTGPMPPASGPPTGPVMPPRPRRVRRTCRCNSGNPVPFVDDEAGHFTWCWDQLETTEGNDR